MEIWIDAQLSPALALWINELNNGVVACSVRSIGLRDAADEVIFKEAKARHAAIMSKDADFVKLLEKHGPPPQIIWITIGNTSNAHMREILTKHFSAIIDLLKNNEPLIEIQGS